jgi:hypothetical protein
LGSTRGGSELGILADAGPQWSSQNPSIED